MSQKRRVSPSFQSIKSLPVDFRFVGSPNSQLLLEKSSGGILSESNSTNGEVTSDVIERVNGNADVENDESPYSDLSLSAEERPSVAADDLNSESSPLQSTGLSSVESKWSDTKSYSAKKVFIGCVCVPQSNTLLDASTIVVLLIFSFQIGLLLETLIFLLNWCGFYGYIFFASPCSM